MPVSCTQIGDCRVLGSCSAARGRYRAYVGSAKTNAKELFLLNLSNEIKTRIPKN